MRSLDSHLEAALHGPKGLRGNTSFPWVRFPAMIATNTSRDQSGNLPPENDGTADLKSFEKKINACVRC
jgi:hypothetical protein